MTLLDSQMTLYKYELEYHLALTEYEKNVANLEAARRKALLAIGGIGDETADLVDTILGHSFVGLRMRKRKGGHCP